MKINKEIKMSFQKQGITKSLETTLQKKNVTRNIITQVYCKSSIEYMSYVFCLRCKVSWIEKRVKSAMKMSEKFYSFLLVVFLFAYSILVDDDVYQDLVKAVEDDVSVNLPRAHTSSERRVYDLRCVYNFIIKEEFNIVTGKIEKNLYVKVNDSFVIYPKSSEKEKIIHFFSRH